MTPKEKAQELFYKFQPHALEICFDPIQGYNTKQCALIAVDEIMKANPIIPLEFMLESEALDAANQYWNEVKQEIEKL